MEISSSRKLRSLVKSLDDRDEFIWKDIEEKFDIVFLSPLTSLANMFEKTKFSKIDLRGLDTSQVTSMRKMFSECYKLKEVILFGLDTSKVTDMSMMFSECIRLPALDVSSLNTNNVETMERMFVACRRLLNLDLSKFNTANVKTMDHMFYKCADLSELIISGFDTSNVENMSGMFARCKNLDEIDVSNFNTGKVKNIDSMFLDCKSLSELDISHFVLDNCEFKYGHTFEGLNYRDYCEIKLPKGYEITSDGSIEKEYNFEDENCFEYKWFDNLEEARKWMCDVNNIKGIDGATLRVSVRGDIDPNSFLQYVRYGQNIDLNKCLKVTLEFEREKEEQVKEDDRKELLRKIAEMSGTNYF